MNIGNIITAVLMTVAGRLIAAFGLSFVTYVGLNEVQSRIVAAIAENLNTIPKEALQIAYIAGLGVVLNWIIGAFAFVISTKSLTKLAAGISKKIERKSHVISVHRRTRLGQNLERRFPCSQNVPT